MALPPKKFAAEKEGEGTQSAGVTSSQKTKIKGEEGRGIDLYRHVGKKERCLPLRWGEKGEGKKKEVSFLILFKKRREGGKPAVIL